MKLTAKQQQARKMVCMPLDGLSTMNAAENRVKELSPVVGLFKVGKETYTRFGPDAIKMVQEYGADVFLDLKYHDIPNTVRGAANAAAQLGVYMFNVHASGGQEMMQAAVKGAMEGTKQYGTVTPKITAVTILTSLDNLRYIQNTLPIIEKLPVGSLYEKTRTELCNFPFSQAINADIRIREEKNEYEKLKLQKLFLEVYGNPFDSLLKRLNLDDIVPDSVLNYAKMAHNAGLDGIVCSAADLYAVKDKMPSNFMFVTPGIKGPNTPAGEDQKRVFTPGNAAQDGSDIEVIGRTITGQKTSEARVRAGHEILEDIAKHL
ncbi:orotidine 5'-phosphate decarboxylase [Candidatus Pacearchaeota archaeon]|nr:orotidine 5'-phosphate decarboxylase [Candidatus Pacearchaeota archaeon]